MKKERKKVLQLATISAMIEGFNMHNIHLLKELGYEVHVAANFQEADPEMQEQTNAFKQKLQNDGLTVFDLPFHREPIAMDNVTAYRKLKQLIRVEYYDLIHCHSPVGGLLGRLAARAARSTGTKVLYTAHGFHFFKGAPLKNWLLYYPVEKYLSQFTDCLITINPEDYQQAYHRKFYSKRIEKINGVGIDTAKFSPTNDKRRNDLRRQHGYNESDKLMVYVGELSHRKNQELAIRVMQQVVQNIPEARLLLVGDGEPEVTQALKQLVQELKLEKHVSFLGYRRDVPELMALADVALSTSRQEGLPVNVMEAMGTGLPLVVSNCRGNRDLVQHKVNGFVIEEMEPALFAEKIQQLLTDKNLRAQFGTAGTRLIEAYSHDCVDRSMRRIYQSYNAAHPVESLIVQSASRKEMV